MYDLLITGAELIDPGGGHVGRFDLAINQGRVAAIAPQIDFNLATKLLHADGLILTPGLIDLHTHIYWGVTYWGIQADPVAAKTGVTTWVDAGSAGAYSFPGFREYVVLPSRVRIACFLNLSAIGLIAPTWEFSNPDYCDMSLALRTIEANRDIIVGIKARIDLNTTRGVGIQPLVLARTLADQAQLPLMVHIGSGPPTLPEIAELLREGDILTHCFTGGNHRILTEDAKIAPLAWELQQRGVIMDIGHGTGSFVYDVAEGALAEGFLPDVISSDIHQLSRQGPMYDLPTTLAKFLSLGMPLPDVIERATIRPALAMRRPDLGCLRVGDQADFALFRLAQSELPLYDVAMNARLAPQRLICQATYVAGVALEQISERPPALWADLPPHQRSYKEQ